jgi:LacI family transcriptional regulator
LRGARYLRIEDIARRAKVSKAAVSLALNNKAGVSEETRKKIFTIAKEVGYIPRSLIKADQIYNKKYLRFLACVKSDVVSMDYHRAPFFMELIHDIEEQCQNLGYSLTFSTLKFETYRQEIEKLEKEHPSTGIIALGTNLTPKEVRSIILSQPKLVILDSIFNLLNIDCIVMNNFQGAYSAAVHLIRSGHRNIGYVESHTRITNFEQRKEGFMTALQDHNITINKKDIFLVTPEIDEVYHEFKKIANDRANTLPSALFCENDYIGIGLIKALNELNVKIPERVSIIGFDNIPQTTIISPELTTIHVDKRKMARMAVQRLNEIIENDDSTSIKIIIDTKLVERESCSAHVSI